MGLQAALGSLVERLVVGATHDVQLLATLTPSNALAERERLVQDVRAGRTATPRWTYAPVAHDELRRALDAAARSLEDHEGGPVERLYVERLRELSIEAALSAAAGSDGVAALARARFAPGDARIEREASTLGA